ncbi:MAG TPA: hypothetical protein V6C71_00705 [Coleofasciculaceae cyanobacterium]|jgi:hypothetical protein
MSDQNSSPDNIVRPEDLMAELDLKKSTYYDDLNYLGISANKDENKKAYLTIDQANQVRALRSYVIENGKRDGFVYGGLVVSNNSDLAINSAPNSIYVEAEEPTANVDINALLRGAAQLKARELATPNLLIRELANRMTEDDLPDDLREKVALAREVANPKWTPAEIATQLLAQHRSQKGQVEG